MESLLQLRHSTVEKFWTLPLVSTASGTVGTLVGTGLGKCYAAGEFFASRWASLTSYADLTKTVIHGSLQLIDSGVTKATDLAKSSLQFVKRSVNTGADFAISALDTAKTKTSGTIKVSLEIFNWESNWLQVQKFKFFSQIWDLQPYHLLITPRSAA